MSKTAVMNGNKAAATGAKLARPDLVSAYPITPQTALVEYLIDYVNRGEMAAEVVAAESEHSVMSILQGAAMAGSRVFTGTSAVGLAYMFEPYQRTSTLRLPMVMCIVNREMSSPQTVWGGQQDAIMVRDAGWIQIFAESNQEILDTILMAYRVAEHPDVLLPVNVCYDGFYLSHLTEKVEIPAQEEVDNFLPPYRPSHLWLDPERPIAIDPLAPGEALMEYRRKHLQAMEKAKEVIPQVDREFARLFGRGYGGLLEEYRTADAEAVLVTMGSASGTGKVAVDRAREEGIRVGLVKLRVLRPFPSEALAEALSGKKAIAVIDRNVSFGWNSGTVYQEIKGALYDAGLHPYLKGYIAGLGGMDITLDHFRRVIGELAAAVKGRGPSPARVSWLGIEVEET